MKKLFFTLALAIACLVSNNINAQSLERRAAIDICECSHIIENNVSPEFREIINFKLIAETEDEFNTAMITFVTNNPDKAAKDLEWMQSMSDDNGQFLRCISKMEMKYDNTELDTPEMYNSIMVELYEIECDFAAALFMFGAEVQEAEVTEG
ncbi:MAG: hypothetical protein NWR69_07360, partial [Flavobacteriales bacterium]|nr:hypothetical protein [Flavobacteriales bacterium]MDP4818810.1 hypothetical protein [Flavobacteriales bacterium]